jgi:hypothetical protein
LFGGIHGGRPSHAQIAERGFTLTGGSGFALQHPWWLRFCCTVYFSSAKQTVIFQAVQCLLLLQQAYLAAGFSHWFGSFMDYRKSNSNESKPNKSLQATAAAPASCD